MSAAVLLGSASPLTMGGPKKCVGRLIGRVGACGQGVSQTCFNSPV